MRWEDLELRRNSALHQKSSDSLVFIFVWKGTMENVIIFLARAEDRKSSTSVELHFCDTGVKSVSCLMTFLIFILNSPFFCVGFFTLSLLGFLIQDSSNGVLLGLHHSMACNLTMFFSCNETQALHMSGVGAV